MKIQKSREIIIEYEKIQIIRKRVETMLEICTECRTIVDFISLNEAATLLNTKCEILFQFIKDTSSHFQTKKAGEISICLNSLLARMKERSENLPESLNAKAKTIRD